MEIKRVALEDLVEDPNNPRTHPLQNLMAIRDSLQRFGQVEPLVVRAGLGVVIGGNGRLSVMREMGWDSAEVVELELTDQQAAALSVALNRSGELAEWDTEVLRDILDDLGTEDFDVGAFALSDTDLNALMVQTMGDGSGSNEDKKDVKQDDVPEPPKTAITKLGDVWELGRHRVVCGDCTEVNWGRREFGMVFTDPPYGVKYQSRVDKNRRKSWGVITNDDLGTEALEKLVHVAVPEAPFRYVCTCWESLGVFERALGKPRSVCVWDKEWFGLGKGYRRQFELIMFYGTLNRTDLSDVWTFSRDNDYKHPTQKPVALAVKAIHDCGADDVYDPFLGSGTTLIAAEQLDRTCYGIEIEPRYVDVAVERWENLVGAKARRSR